MIPGPQGSLLAGGDLAFAVLDSNAHVSGYPGVPILSNGNLTYTQALNTVCSAMATIGANQGGRYFEVHHDTLGNLLDNTDIGVAEADGTLVAYIWNDGNGYIRGWVNDGNGSITYGVVGNGTIGCLLDLDGGTVTFQHNGATVFTRTLGGHGQLYPFIARGAYSGRAVSVETFNLGASAWAYDPGAGWTGWTTEV